MSEGIKRAVGTCRYVCMHVCGYLGRMDGWMDGRKSRSRFFVVRFCFGSYVVHVFYQLLSTWHYSAVLCIAMYICIAVPLPVSRSQWMEAEGLACYVYL